MEEQPIARCRKQWKAVVSEVHITNAITKTKTKKKKSIKSKENGSRNSPRFATNATAMRQKSTLGNWRK